MNSSHRMSVMRNLAISLIKNGKIKTTLAKAKDLRSFVEPIITKAKIHNFNSIRIISSKLGNSNIISALFEIGKKFVTRNGGYTRIIKNGNRYGDFAETAVIELV